MTDVLDRTRGADYYVGNLQGVVALRITDRQNGLAVASTVSDLPLTVDMPCIPDFAGAGSTCSAVTTMNALIAGLGCRGQALDLAARYGAGVRRWRGR